MILAEEDCKRLTIVVTAPVEVIDRITDVGGKHSLHMRALLRQLRDEIDRSLDEVNVKVSVVEIPRNSGLIL